MAGRTQGDARESTGSLDPSTRLTLREAATLAGVDESALAQLCDDGVLLFETERRRRKEVRVVRLRDLADVHPEVLGRAPDSPRDAPAEADASEDVEAVEPAVAVAADSVADAVRSSGTSRDALIELCQDLETRLDLAERERQASTASLLMAQRRVLDLELQARPRPWARAGGALLGLLSVAVLGLVWKLPAAVRSEAASEAEALRSALTADLESVRHELQTATSAHEDEREMLVERLETSDGIVAEGRRAFEELAREARVERVASGEERARLEGALRELEQRLVAAEGESGRRRAELDLLVESAGRDRARFAERLAATERALDDARAQLAGERRASADDRATFERTLAEIERASDDASALHADELLRLRRAVEEALERPAATATKGAKSSTEKQPGIRTSADSWVGRAIQSLSGGAVVEVPAERTP
ncbi:MAG: hypothetical protein AAGI22_03530 [Planctomycetota bacterium]